MVHEGYLLKQGEKGIKTWKRRWFAIRTGNGVPGRRPHLYYFNKTNEIKEKGRIDLEQAIEIGPCKDSPKEFFDFSIITPKRVYRLRASTKEEMNEWVKELRQYQAEGAAKLSVGSYDRKSSFSSSASAKAFPPLTKDIERPASVMPGFRLSTKETTKPTATPTTQDLPEPKISPVEAPPTNITPKQPRIEPIQSNASHVRQSIREMRTAALQSEPKVPEASQIERKSNTASTPSWGAQEDSKELQTARKRLGKAQNLNTKYENEIRSLRDKVSSLTSENHDLKEKIDARDNTVDFDKKRREAELEDLKQKLESEKKLREELDLQFQDVRNELRTLKQSIHIARTAPNIHSIAANEAPVLGDNQVGTLESSLPDDRARSVTRSAVFDSNLQPLIRGGVSRSSSVSNISALSIIQKTGDGKRTPWVRDEQVIRCLACKREFGLFTRKHHCRNCGLIFCSDCSERTYPHVKGYNEPQRVCDKCFASLRTANTRKKNEEKRADKHPHHHHHHEKKETNPKNPPVENSKITHTRQASYEDPPVQILDL